MYTLQEWQQDILRRTIPRLVGDRNAGRS
jgi:hypothetical protein